MEVVDVGVDRNLAAAAGNETGADSTGKKDKEDKVVLRDKSGCRVLIGWPI